MGYLTRELGPTIVSVIVSVTSEVIVIVVGCFKGY